jgi:DNA polymerase III epsilon subunit-like protein
VSVHAAVDERVAVAALWGAVRIVVIDTETTVSPDGGPLRAVSVAAVTCRLGTVRGKFQTLINPEVPVDPQSRRIHGITDEHLIGEPTFADVASLLVPLLTEADGERLVLAAHNVGFDVSVLRNELQLIGSDLPDIPVIDTMGKLPSLVDVRPPTKSLANLLGTLGLSNERPHDALADAVACAEALVELLNRAAAQGHTDFDELLAEISGGLTTHSAQPSKPHRGDNSDVPASLPVLSPAHVETHTTPLSRRAGRRMLDTWRTNVGECAELRCRHLDARVSEAEPKPDTLLDELDAVLADRCAAADTAGAATVLGALLPLLEHLPPRKGRLGFREAALFWAKKWSPKLILLERCDKSDPCPACRRYDPCPLDVWPDTIARIALGDPDQYAKGFFEMTGREAGTGAYTSWARRRIDPRVGDAAVWLCVQHWNDIGQAARAEQVVHLAWDAGCRHPDVGDAYAGQLAAAGRLADLTAAIAICDTALAGRDDSTHEGWLRLQSRRNQLAGRAQRLQLRPSGHFDEDGNPIPLRRHHPDTPHRQPRARFVNL